EGIALCLQWIPGHCNNPGNDAPDRLAKEAGSPARRRSHATTFALSGSGNGLHPPKAITCQELTALYQRPIPESRMENLSRNRAYLLTQQCKGHNWLFTFPEAFNFRVNGHCTCGAQETVTHLLVDCPRLNQLRRELKRKKKSGGRIHNRVESAYIETQEKESPWISLNIDFNGGGH
ncbi:hypothetical protein N7447_004341, partial [Penicillium robsamsonii]|uniref:uncharacterized protein n=1 Tax=Penicillium robsamsonii TaxID=1792511 RepID=UPI0025476275